MPPLKQKAVFAVRKARTAFNMFSLGWGLRLPFVSRDMQQALRRRLLDVRRSHVFRHLRLARGEIRGKLNRINGSIDYRSERNALRAIEAAGLISFDFYDTLFTRISATPDDILHYIGHVLHIEGLDDENQFYLVRRRADAAARIADTRGDVTLAQIYDAFPANWRKEQRIRAMALELSLELRVLQPRRSVVALSRMAMKTGPHPIIVSDTCMDAAFIGSVLHKHGLSEIFDKIYCSSDVLRRKDDGTIWPWLKQNLPTGHVGFTHLGDNRKSDVLQPRKFGVTAIGLPDAASTAELRGFPVPKHWRSANHDWRSGIVLGPAIAKIGNDPFLKTSHRRVEFEHASDFGYCVMGPIVFAFTSWIMQRAKADGIDRFFFLSRDGYFLQKIYETCTRGYKYNAPHADYICVSRRSILPASVYIAYDLTLLLKSRFKGRLQDLIKGRIGVDISQFVGPDVAGQDIRLPQDRQRVTDFMMTHKDVIRGDLKATYDTLMRYLDQTGFLSANPAAVIDFSSSGTIQLAMQSLIQRGMTGYYFMVSRAFSTDDNHNGRSVACFVDAHDQWQLQPVQAGAILLEGLLTAPYGQMTHYMIVDGKVIPVCDPEPDSGAHFDAIRQTMEGAEHYCRDLVEAYGSEVLLIDVPKADVQRPLSAFLSGRLTMPKALRDAITVEDDFGGNGRMKFYS